MNKKAVIGIALMVFGIFLMRDTIGAFIALSGAILYGDNELKT